jgi:hypothetical protein
MRAYYFGIIVSVVVLLSEMALIIYNGRETIVESKDLTIIPEHQLV